MTTPTNHCGFPTAPSPEMREFCARLMADAAPGLAALPPAEEPDLEDDRDHESYLAFLAERSDVDVLDGWVVVERSEYGEAHQLMSNGAPLATVYPSGSWVAAGSQGDVYGRGASTPTAKRAAERVVNRGEAA